MEKALRKAIEGGYAPCEFTPYHEVRIQRKGTGLWGEWVSFTNSIGEACMFDVSKIVLDPLFWQALGKALGWYNHKLRGSRGECLECGAPQCEIEWHANWHRFIDHLAEGKDPETFFTNLLTEQES